jgi:hypothetical protein
MTLTLSRRRLFGLIPLPLLSVATPARGLTFPPVLDGRDQLARLARAYAEVHDRLADVVEAGELDMAYDFDDGTPEADLDDAFDRAEDALHEAMAERGIHAFCMDGRTFLNLQAPGRYIPDRPQNVHITNREG